MILRFENGIKFEMISACPDAFGQNFFFLTFAIISEATMVMAVRNAMNKTGWDPSNFFSPPMKTVSETGTASEKKRYYKG